MYIYPYIHINIKHTCYTYVYMCTQIHTSVYSHVSLNDGDMFWEFISRWSLHCVDLRDWILRCNWQCDLWVTVTLVIHHWSKYHYVVCDFINLYTVAFCEWSWRIITSTQPNLHRDCEAIFFIIIFLLVKAQMVLNKECSPYNLPQAKSDFVWFSPVWDICFYPQRTTVFFYLEWSLNRVIQKKIIALFFLCIWRGF